MFVPFESLSFLLSSKDLGVFPRGWYSPADGPWGEQKQLLFFPSQDLIHNTLLLSATHHLFNNVLTDSRTRLESQVTMISLAPYLGSVNGFGLGHAAGVPDGSEGCLEALTPLLLAFSLKPILNRVVQVRREGPQPFQPDLRGQRGRMVLPQQYK